VPPERLPQVLQRFGRESRDTRGAGLGLSIVEEIAQLFGGSMAVASAAGAGFRVTVRFPAQAGTARESRL
jgi:two-component system sensor histidine kinase TctE